MLNLNETPPVENGAPSGAPPLTGGMEAAVAESRARLADEPQIGKRGGRRPGSGRKPKDPNAPGAGARPVVPDAVLGPRTEMPSMAPALTQAVVNISKSIAARRDFPAYALDEKQALPIADAFDKVMMRYGGSVSTNHPELFVLGVSIAVTFGPIVLADLADKDARERKAREEMARQSELKV